MVFSGVRIHRGTDLPHLRKQCWGLYSGPRTAVIRDRLNSEIFANYMREWISGLFLSLRPRKGLVFQLMYVANP